MTRGRTTMQAKPKFDPSKLLTEDPNGNSDARCPHCDADGFYGVDVTVTASQAFSGETYDSYEDEIGDYEFVTCGSCERIVWYDRQYYLPDEQIDAMIDSINNSQLAGAAAYLLNSHRLSVLIAQASGNKEEL